MLIKEINAILKCKCTFHSFNLIEQEQGWTNNNDMLDLSLFYHDKLLLIQKGIIKLLESIITVHKTHYRKNSFQQDGKYETFSL